MNTGRSIELNHNCFVETYPSRTNQHSRVSGDVSKIQRTSVTMNWNDGIRRRVWNHQIAGTNQGFSCQEWIISTNWFFHLARKGWGDIMIAALLFLSNLMRPIFPNSITQISAWFQLKPTPLKTLPGRLHLPYFITFSARMHDFSCLRLL